MNWTDEEIDKLFQESASQMNAPAFQDSFWTEMEAMLPQKQKKKGLGWIFGGTLTSFALIAAMIFPGNQFNGNGKSASAASTKAQQAQNQQAQGQQAYTESTQQIQTQSGAQQAGVQTALALRTEQTFTGSGASTMKSTRSGKRLKTKPAGTTEMEGEVIPTLPADLTSEVIYKEPQPENASRLELLSFTPDEQQLMPLQFGKFNYRTKKNTFYAQAGFGMTQSNISGSDKNWMPAVNLGAGYQYKPQGIGFSAGLNINASFANNLEITRRSKVYNFSSTNYEQKLMYRQLYSIELPISVDFRKNRHTLSLGIAPTYLATTVMRFSQFENDALAQDGVYINQRTGLNSFGLKPSIGYQLEVAKSWNVGIQLNTQLVKQVDETQFVGNLTNFPLSGQITIRKTLTR